MGTEKTRKHPTRIGPIHNSRMAFANLTQGPLSILTYPQQLDSPGTPNLSPIQDGLGLKLELRSGYQLSPANETQSTKEVRTESQAVLQAGL